jgi:hypothetical protein
VAPRERLLADNGRHGGRGSDQTRMQLSKLRIHSRTSIHDNRGTQRLRIGPRSGGLGRERSCCWSKDWAGAFSRARSSRPKAFGRPRKCWRCGLRAGLWCCSERFATPSWGSVAASGTRRCLSEPRPGADMRVSLWMDGLDAVNFCGCRDSDVREYFVGQTGSILARVRRDPVGVTVFPPLAQTGCRRCRRSGLSMKR